MKNSILFFLALSGLLGCSSSSDQPFRIGVDPTWYPQNFAEQTAYINGFVDDLLLEIAWHERIEWEKISANSDTALEGLQNNKYDALLTSLPRYTFHLAKYDFSENFLDLGPVLIVPSGSSYKNFEDVQGGIVGVIAGSEAETLLLKNPFLTVQSYINPPALLNAIVSGEIMGAFLDVLSAESFVGDIYSGKLMIIHKPLNDNGLHLIVKKGENKTLFRLFEEGLKWAKKKKLNALLEKWNLTTRS